MIQNPQSPPKAMARKGRGTAVLLPKKEMAPELFRHSIVLIRDKMSAIGQEGKVTG